MPCPALLVPVTQAFVAAIKAFVQQGNINLVRFAKGERTQFYPRRWSDGEGALNIG